MPTGIVKRHSRSCRFQNGSRCNCEPSYQAWISRKEKDRHQKIRKTFSGPGALSAAKAWRDDASQRKRSGALRRPATTTLRQEAEEWLAAARSGEVRLRSGRRYKPSTLRGYKRGLNYITEADIGYLRLTEIRRPDVQAFADTLIRDGLSGATVANILNPLQAIYRRALARDLVAFNPTTEVQLPRDGRRRDRIASPLEAARLLDALGSDDRALWATAFYGGLRRGELCALRWSDIDLGKGEIHVQRGWDQEEGELDDTKSAAGDRVLPVLTVLRDYLDQHKIATGRGGDDLVFGRTASDPFVPSTVRNRALVAWETVNAPERKAAEEEEREPDLIDPITLHECRHTFASMLIHAGVNPKAIQEFMGYSTIEMTFDRYGHLMPGSRDEARERVDAYLAAACAPNAGQNNTSDRGSQEVVGG